MTSSFLEFIYIVKGGKDLQKWENGLKVELFSAKLAFVLGGLLDYVSIYLPG